MSKGVSRRIRMGFKIGDEVVVTTQAGTIFTEVIIQESKIQSEEIWTTNIDRPDRPARWSERSKVELSDSTIFIRHMEDKCQVLK